MSNLKIFEIIHEENYWIAAHTQEEAEKIFYEEEGEVIGEATGSEIYEIGPHLWGLYKVEIDEMEITFRQFLRLHPYPVVVRTTANY